MSPHEMVEETTNSCW